MPHGAVRLRWPWLVAALLLASPVWWASSLQLTLFSQTAATAVVCMSLALLMGQGGMVSFGHAVYSGLGGFAVLHALNAMPAGHSAAWVPALPLLGAAAGAAAAALLGWLCTRQAGLSFAMISLGLGELVYAGALMWPEVFGGEAGVRADRAQGRPWLGLDFAAPAQVYALVAAYALAAAALAAFLPRTPFGLVLAGVRDNPGRAAGLGHDPHRVRWIAFTLAGAGAGLGGALLALVFESVSAEAMSGLRSGTLLLFTFVGGVAGLAGPLLGAVLLVGATVWLSSWTQAWGLYVGVLFLAVVMGAPGGIAAWLGGLRWRPDTRGAVGAAAALALAAGLMLALEMLYHRQLQSALGPQLRWAGLNLDTGQPGAWLAALGLAVGGAMSWRWARR